MRRRLPALEALAVFALAATALLVTRDHAKDDAPTMDEGIHLFAGSEYLEAGTFWMNPEHPPLLKLLGAAALRPLGLRAPADGKARDVTPHNHYLRWLYGNRAPAHAIVQAGRRPFPWLLVALVLLTALVARSLWGSGAAVLAAGLVALDPSFVAHAGVVHTDVGASLATLAAVAALLLAAQGAGLTRWALAGAVVGLALAVKFTCIALVPVACGFAALGAFRSGSLSRRRAILTAISNVALAGGAAAAVLLSVYGFAGRRMGPERAEASVRSFLVGRQVPGPAVERAALVARVLPPLGLYSGGLLGVARFSTAGRGANFFRGEVYEGSRPLYFPAAFALKSTPAFLLALALAALLGGRLLLEPRALALVVPAAFLFGLAVFSAFNIGHRHLLPIYPLLAVTAAGALATRLRPLPFGALAAGLLGSSAVSLALVHPHELTYFNFIAGGPEGGARVFSDSNVDWGQDLARLGAVLHARGVEQQTTIVAYGGVASNYFSRTAKVLDPSRPIAPGLYAVAATMEALGPHAMAFLEGPESAAQVAELLRQLRERGVRLERIGSITLWELPPAPAPAPP